MHVPRQVWIRSQAESGDSVLDIGAADNVIWRDLPFPVKVTTIDNHVRSAQDVDLLADANDLPFADHSFDLTCLCEILEHIPEPRRPLMEALRVARRKVVVTVPNEWRWPPSLLPFCHSEHVHYFTAPQFLDLLKSTGRPFTFEEITWNGGWHWLASVLYP